MRYLLICVLFAVAGYTLALNHPPKEIPYNRKVAFIFYSNGVKTACLVQEISPKDTPIAGCVGPVTDYHLPTKTEPMTFILGKFE